MDKWIVVHVYNRILQNNEDQQTAVTFNNMDDKWKKQDYRIHQVWFHLHKVPQHTILNYMDVSGAYGCIPKW